jgi:hypothetical protein
MAKKSLVTKPDEKKLPVELQELSLVRGLLRKLRTVQNNNAYVFNVAPRSNKIQIARAIKTMYKVNPDQSFSFC